MKKLIIHLSLALLLSLTLTTLICGQTKNPQTSATPPDEDDDVVKIRTNLVQFDAVVTDKKGNQIKDLTITDFEIIQDGIPQAITNFSYVNTETPAQSSAKIVVKNGKNAVLPPPVRIRPENVGRIITFIVDDGNCTASQVGMDAAQEALKKFIGEQMLPNDVVAIYQTRGGNSLLQQYTSDKTRLMRVAQKIRWLPPTGSCTGFNGDFFKTAKVENLDEAPYQEEIRDNQVVGMIGVLNYVVRGLEKIGGRKIVFLLSDGLPVRQTGGKTRRSVDALRQLIDSANRASVVFNTIDVRGLFNESMINPNDRVFFKDDIDVAKPNGSELVTAERQQEVFSSREGLFSLAEETGGEFFRNQNFLDVPIRRALSIEKGYYLLGYEPPDGTFKDKNYNKIEIRLKREDLKVHSRTGFFGVTDESVTPKKRSNDSDLYGALVAPLPRAGLNVRLAAYFVNDAAQGSVVRSLVHLDGSELKFVDESNGFKKVSLDVVAVTLNEKNEVVDEFNRTHTFKIDEAALPFIKQYGVIYTTDVPVKKAGNYNFRLAVRDAGSKLLGSAAQAIEIPDLKKSRIFMSGLIVNAADANGKFTIPSAVKPENALSPTNSTAVPAIRRFRPNSILAYAYTLYNAQFDKSLNKPNLTVQINLYRDGKIVTEGKPQPTQLEKLTDPARINDYGYLRLNANTEKGDYALQIIVKDLANNETTSQSIDFEVVN